MIIVINIVLVLACIYLYWQLKIDIETISVLKYHMKVIRDDPKVTLEDARGICAMVIKREFTHDL